MDARPSDKLFGMNGFSWRPLWYQVLIRLADEYEYAPMGPVQPVPNRVIAADSLADWIVELREAADEELDDLTGDLRIEIYDAPDGGDLVRSAQGSLHP